MTQRTHKLGNLPKIYARILEKLIRTWERKKLEAARGEKMESMGRVCNGSQETTTTGDQFSPRSPDGGGECGAVGGSCGENETCDKNGKVRIFETFGNLWE